jgi:hypothetical protein
MNVEASFDQIRDSRHAKTVIFITHLGSVCGSIAAEQKWVTNWTPAPEPSHSASTRIVACVTSTQ